MIRKWKEKLKVIEKIKEIKSKKSLRNIIIAAAVFLLLTGASIYTVFVKPNLEREQYVYIEESVQKGDLILGIMESGSLSLEETTLDYTLELNTDEEEDDSDEEEEEEDSVKYLEVEEVYAVSGKRIEEGEALFKLTDKSVDAVRKKLTTLLTEAEIALSEAETEYKIELLQAKSTYDTSILSFNRAKNSYNASSTKTQESINGLSGDIKILEAEIDYYTEQLAEESLWESLEEAETAYASAKNIYEDTDVHNATAYASNYADYKSAGEQLESIRGQIDELKESIEKNQKSIAEKQQQMAEAQNGLEIESLTNESAYHSAVLGGELAQDIYNYTVSSLEEAVNTAQNERDEAQNNLEELNSFVGEDGIIYADGTGLVTNVSYRKGDDLVNTGAMLSYVKENAYTVSIDVSEEDISAVKVGDKVDIVMTAYPEETYEGTVTSITTTATSDYAATVSYPVTIRIEGNTKKLYGGMTAEVTFVTDSVSEALYVSRKAVQEIDGKYYVYTKGSGGSRKLTEVITGFTDGTSIEIISGLSEGDTVYIESRISGSEADLMESDTDGKEQEMDAENQDAAETGSEAGMTMPEADMEGIPDLESMPDGGNMGAMPKRQ